MRLPGIFRGARWALLLLVPVWVMVIVKSIDGNPEDRSLLEPAACLLLSTFCVTLWINHVRLIRSVGATGLRMGGLVVAWSLYDLLALATGVMLCSAAFLLLSGPDERILDRHAHLRELIREAKSIEVMVEEQVALNKSLAGAGKGLNVASTGRIAGGVIAEDGVIVVVGKDPQSTIVLAPTLAAGKVAWKCDMYPKRGAIADCR